MADPKSLNNQLEAPANGDTPSDERVYDRMYDAIVARSLVPGARLKEQDLAEIFGVNRSVVRQAMSRLSQEKLVVLSPNRGCFVAEPSVKEARDVFYTRRLIEEQLLRRLMASIRETHIETLSKHIEQEQKAHAERRFRRMVRLSAGFHILIGDLADIPTITRYLRQLVAQCSLIKTTYQRWVHVERGAEDHEAILADIKGGDVEDAVKTMDAHLKELEDELDLDNPVSVTPDLHTIFADLTK